MQFVIEAASLSKAYDSTKVVDSVDFAIPQGSLTGFLGPNGAGKTTTIKMLLGLLRPTSGVIKIFGFNIRESEPWIRTKIGYIPENLSFPRELTAETLLSIYGRMCGSSGKTLKEKVHHLIELVGLTDEEKKRVGKYSKGMLQRLGFAHALLNDPNLLILDEPLIGLDPPSIVKFRNLIKELNRKGTTVFLSSHLLHEVQQTCTDIIIINKGRIARTAKVSELSFDTRTQFKTLVLELKEVNPRVLELLGKLPYITKLEKISKSTIKLNLQATGDVREQLFHTLAKAGVVFYSMNYEEASLEDILLGLMEEDSSKRNAA